MERDGFRKIFVSVRCDNAIIMVWKHIRHERLLIVWWNIYSRDLYHMMEYTFVCSRDLYHMLYLIFCNPTSAHFLVNRCHYHNTNQCVPNMQLLGKCYSLQVKKLYVVNNVITGSTSNLRKTETCLR